MASYPKVLPAQPDYGFLQGLAGGLGKGAGLYSQAALKSAFADKSAEKKAARAEEGRSKFAEAAKKSGLKLSGLKYDEEGKGSYSYELEEDPRAGIIKNPKKAIMQAMMGIGDLGDVGETFAVERPKPLPKKTAEAAFPVASLTGQAKDISSTGGPMDYNKVVQQAMKKRFAPGVSQDVISRDFLGLPQEKATIPKEFTSDVQKLKKISGGDENVFVAGLQKLGMKYVDDPTILNRIKLIIQAVYQTE